MSKSMKVIITIILIAILFAVSNVNYVCSSNQEVTAKLDKITTRTENSGSAKHPTSKIYYLYTFRNVENENNIITCKNEDSLYLLKYNSGDFEAILKEGRTYKLTYRGARWHLFSTYPNIVNLEEVK